MFEKLHYITLEMKLFLYPVFNIESMYFFFSQQKYIHKRMESSSPSEKLERCALSRVPNQQSRRIVDIPISVISLRRVTFQSSYTVYAMVYVQEIQHVVHLPDLSIFCITVSTHCLVPINNDFLSINNHSSTHTLLGLFDT